MAPRQKDQQSAPATLPSVPLPVGGWPLDENGKPMALITAQSAELLAIPNTFSNITIGPLFMARFVKDTPNNRKRGIEASLAQLEEIAGDNRERLYNSVMKHIESQFNK